MNPESFKKLSRAQLRKIEYEQREEMARNYYHLIGDYRQIWHEINKLEQKYHGMTNDPEVRSRILFLDNERHLTHLKLFEEAAKLGKTKADVLLEIIQSIGLSEYGLEEFSIEELQPGDEDETTLKKGEMLIVFDIVTIDALSEEPEYSSDYEIRKKRAEELAKEIKSRLTYKVTGKFHQRVEYLGVAIHPEDIEKVAAIIRNNPKKFRLGKEFYE